MLAFVVYSVLIYLVFSWSYGLWEIREEKCTYTDINDLGVCIITHFMAPLWVPFTLIERLRISQRFIKIFCKIYNHKYEP